MPPAPHEKNPLAARLEWDALDTAFLRRLVTTARLEDLDGLGLRRRPRATGDRSTATIAAGPRKKKASADIVARSPLVLCGAKLIPLVLSAYAPNGKNAPPTTCRLRAGDGQRLAAGDVVATLSGDPRRLLAAERVLLNFLQKLSGTATETARYVDALGATQTRLLDTRKTTPGWRMLEKYAVACGGAWNHRLGLFDRVMLKDNHLALLGSAENLAAAVRAAKKTRLPVEVEVDRLDQIPAVLDAGADILLLDNFTPARIRRAVALVAGRAQTEASGGITLRNIRRYANLGLTFISSGALVHHASWADIALDWKS
ncbi:MAG: carboxylating nicotinate-nucleotide diphosphorylase [Opitutaceae bacterium]|jgi:nicotinate-nucleotide pyrophosphorylase (carboxylating)|nr:carboxylating nicotinate-nucleotide diphosphorylase [Opitutaceae bacterium]